MTFQINNTTVAIALVVIASAIGGYVVGMAATPKPVTPGLYLVGPKGEHRRLGGALADKLSAAAAEPDPE